MVKVTVHCIKCGKDTPMMVDESFLRNYGIHTSVHPFTCNGRQKTEYGDIVIDDMCDSCNSE